MLKNSRRLILIALLALVAHAVLCAGASVPALAQGAPQQDLPAKGTTSREAMGEQIVVPAEGAAPTDLIVNAEPETFLPDGVTSTEGLLEVYVSQRVDKSLSSDQQKSLDAQSAGSKLTGADLVAYTKLKEMVSKVAAGTRGSTVFEIPQSELLESTGPWTAADLGVGSLLVDDQMLPGAQLTFEAEQAIFNRIYINYKAIIAALLADCPYELYWYDKVGGNVEDGSGNVTTFGTTYRPYVRVFEMDGELYADCSGNLALSMPVCADYSATGQLNTTEVDTSIGASISGALDTAARVVKENRDKATLDCLKAYKDAICERVAYNEAVDAGAYPMYGNPWQLIWVFDDDPNTNVVCEGYAKAFKYLCDLTWPDKNVVDCRLVTGQMLGGTGAGTHMWNVVRMDDGRNYLADITNCDDEAIGFPEELLLAYGPTGDWNATYGFAANEVPIDYAYDEETKWLFGQEGLEVSPTPYKAPAPKPVEAPTTVKNLTYTGSEQTGVASAEGYSVEGGAATAAGSHTATATLEEGYVWSDNTTEPKQIEWSIAKASISPSVSIPYWRFGQTAAEPSVSGNTDKGAVTYRYGKKGTTTFEFGEKAPTHAGNYVVEATVAATKNCKAGTATAEFVIARADSKISIAPQTKKYNGKAQAYSGKVTKSGSDGKVTYKYYADAKCTKEIKAADVKAAGTYYVKARVASNNDYRAATSAATKLTIKE